MVLVSLLLEVDVSREAVDSVVVVGACEAELVGLLERLFWPELVVSVGSVLIVEACEIDLVGLLELEMLVWLELVDSVGSLAVMIVEA